VPKGCSRIERAEDKRIPNSYPQIEEKIESYNKLLRNKFLVSEDIPNIDDGKIRYDMFAMAYNEARERDGSNAKGFGNFFSMTLRILRVTNNGQEVNPSFND
jgi:hypothetical protein